MNGSRVSATRCTQGGLTVYATLWSQKWGRNFGGFCFLQAIAALFLGPQNSKQELLNGSDGPDLITPVADTSLASVSPYIWTHTRTYNTVYSI